jgi:hypothetical protein
LGDIPLSDLRMKNFRPPRRPFLHPISVSAEIPASLREI